METNHSINQGNNKLGDNGHDLVLAMTWFKCRWNQIMAITSQFIIPLILAVIYFHIVMAFIIMICNLTTNP